MVESTKEYEVNHLFDVDYEGTNFYETNNISYLDRIKYPSLIYYVTNVRNSYTNPQLPVSYIYDKITGKRVYTFDSVLIRKKTLKDSFNHHNSLISQLSHSIRSRRIQTTSSIMYDKIDKEDKKITIYNENNQNFIEICYRKYDIIILTLYKTEYTNSFKLEKVKEITCDKTCEIELLNNNLICVSGTFTYFINIDNFDIMDKLNYNAPKFKTILNQFIILNDKEVTRTTILYDYINFIQKHIWNDAVFDNSLSTNDLLILRNCKQSSISMYELKDITDFVPENEQCSVCLERIKDRYAIVPCGHTQVCKDCLDAPDLTNCPICRSEKTSILRIFE